MTLTLTRTFGLLGLAVALPVLAADPAETELEHNARLLLRWKQDPEHYARLKRDYRAFAELSPARQEQLRKLDRDVAALADSPQKHLLAVLDRYQAFVDRLGDEDRRRLEAVQGKDRVALIEEMLQKQWFEQLPFKLREELAALSPEEKKTRLVRIREEDRERKRLLVAARGRPTGKRPDGVASLKDRPATLNQYPADVYDHFCDHIRPRLTMADWKRLDEADGRVGPLATVLLEFAERYPVLPPIPTRPIPTDLTELPSEFRQRLKNPAKLSQKFKAETEQYRTLWPDFALAVVRFCNANGVALNTPLGASRPSEFSAEIQAVLKKLSEADRMSLQPLEGKWPDYPLKLHEIARRAEVTLPGLTLPQPRADWEWLRQQKERP